MRRLRRLALIVTLIMAALIAAYALFSAIVRPSNDRDWSVDQSVLPYAEFAGPLVTIHNARNFRYQTVDRYTPAWQCTSCNETIEPQFAACWNCGALRGV